MENMKTKLCRLAAKYGTDKYVYTRAYHKELKDKRKSFKKVLELGIGTQGTMKHVKNYKTGASLYMWRDYFPKAQIYGADILPETIFTADRIQTFLCDERNGQDLIQLIEKTGHDIDLFIDDAYHDIRNQINTFKTVMPLLKKDVIYIMEDVTFLYTASRCLKHYDFYIPEGLHTIIIKNKA